MGRRILGSAELEDASTITANDHRRAAWDEGWALPAPGDSSSSAVLKSRRSHRPTGPATVNVNLLAEFIAGLPPLREPSSFAASVGKDQWVVAETYPSSGGLPPRLRAAFFSRLRHQRDPMRCRQGGNSATGLGARAVARARVARGVRPRYDLGEPRLLQSVRTTRRRSSSRRDKTIPP